MTFIEGFIIERKAAIEGISQALVTNFDVPAQRIINAGFATMGVDRFDSQGNDLWEMIQCHRNGWEYEKPLARLTQRWASY
jgi:hypothetical protein